ncbi:MazG nucleotide pyrophosphohydrolase domain-containing protein [Proteinivorax hydrogeniformans]|uniref:MazG nucleotide pyrophosphohydrolase domain-containing protein n=1 Tax=Proteinivorax hydrogeniformans TaxID=1826727 RepID=A0AAU8HTI5_9FIRM
MSQINELLDVIHLLRSENGCPWDKKQTHTSLINYVIEESYEVKDAILSGDMNKIEEELGDLLLQVVLHCQIAKENDDFDFDSCSKKIKDKLIFRHPHIFRDQHKGPISEQEVEAIWKRQKKKESKDFNNLQGLPALLKADKFFNTERGKNDIEKYTPPQKISKISEDFRQEREEDILEIATYLIYLCKQNGHSLNYIMEKSVNNLTEND